MMLLSIGITSYDDYAGAWQTITDLAVDNPEQIKECEFVIVDNNPGSQDSKRLKHFVTKMMKMWDTKGVKYIPHIKKGVAPARNAVFENASGDFVLCLDSHIVFGKNAFERLLVFLKLHEEEQSLITGPVIMDDLKTKYTSQKRHWAAAGLGSWSYDKEELQSMAFEISQQGLGVFCSRRDSWPGFHPEIEGYGCVEHVLCEKYRLAGHRVLCLPLMTWHHRWNIYGDAPFPKSEFTNALNHLIAFNEVEWDMQTVIDHFSPRLSETDVAGLGFAMNLKLEKSIRRTQSPRYEITNPDYLGRKGL